MDSQWLKTQFALHPGKTKTGLAQALALEPSAVSKILKGRRQIKAQEYAAMRLYFGLPVDGERAAQAQGPSSYRLGTLSGDGQLAENDSAPPGEWIIPAAVLGQRTKAPEGEVKVFTIGENSMEPDFRRGEPVLVDLSDTRPAPPGIFVVSDGFGFMVRQCEYVAGSDPPEIKLSAKDSAFSPQTLKHDEFRIIGRVIARLHWL
jgi:hypothetical protein